MVRGPTDMPQLHVENGSVAFHFVCNLPPSFHLSVSVYARDERIPADSSICSQANDCEALR